MEEKPNDRVVLCSSCGKTTTENDAFVVGSNGSLASTWICKECLIIQEAMAQQKRIFSTGATRDSNITKLAYDQGLSVQVLQYYMEYLAKHRTMKDGSLRGWSNWKLGITVDTYRESLMRHTIDAVRKSHGLPLREEMDLKDLLAAVSFNAMGWLFELLVAESNNREGM
jgi:hypothetical protein